MVSLGLLCLIFLLCYYRSKTSQHATGAHPMPFNILCGSNFPYSKQAYSPRTCGGVLQLLQNIFTVSTQRQSAVMHTKSHHKTSTPPNRITTARNRRTIPQRSLCCSYIAFAKNLVSLAITLLQFLSYFLRNMQNHRNTVAKLEKSNQMNVWWHVLLMEEFDHPQNPSESSDKTGTAGHCVDAAPTAITHQQPTLQNNNIHPPNDLKQRSYYYEPILHPQPHSHTAQRTTTTNHHPPRATPPKTNENLSPTPNKTPKPTSGSTPTAPASSVSSTSPSPSPFSSAPISAISVLHPTH